MSPYVVVHTNIIFFFSFFSKIDCIRRATIWFFAQIIKFVRKWDKGQSYLLGNIEFTDLDSSKFVVRQLGGLLRLKYHLGNTNFKLQKTTLLKISLDLFWPLSKTVARQMLIRLINWLQQSETYILINHKPKSCLFKLFYSIPGSSGPDRRKYQIIMMDIWR